MFCTLTQFSSCQGSGVQWKSVGLFYLSAGTIPFFSKSTYRWNLLTSKMKEGSFTLKSRTDTRWCANAAATKAVRLNYGIIKQTLKESNISADEDPTTKKNSWQLT